MSSDETRHGAEAVAGGWQVSWLPGRVVTRTQAVTAMTLAEWVSQQTSTEPGEKWWAHVDAWADELGLSGPAAVEMIGRRHELGFGWTA